ncbi:MAG: sugar phosphate isomerase/epimerase family protein [Isosphaeraceae bacterium]
MIRLGICNELFEGWEFGRVCRTIADLGYEGIELAPFTLAPRITDLSPAQRRTIRSQILDAGLQTIGLHWLLAKTEGFHLTSPDASVRRATADYFKHLAQATHDLGGTLMVLGSPMQRSLLPGVSYPEAFRHAAEVLNELKTTLDDCHVNLCVEPLTTEETDFLTSIDQANELIAEVNHERVKLHLDVKAQSGDPHGTVPDLWRQYGRVAGHAHAQDTNKRGPGMGGVDFAPILRALVGSGYEGWLSVEVFDYSPGAEETAAQSLTYLKHQLEAIAQHPEFRA